MQLKCVLLILFCYCIGPSRTSVVRSREKHGRWKRGAGTVIAAAQLTWDVLSSTSGENKLERTCTIGVANNMTEYTLEHPTSYLDEGDKSGILPLKISPNFAGILQFESFESTWKTTGSEGIFTYDIFGAKKVLIVVYDVPQARDYYDNKFYAYIADDPYVDVTASEDLFDSYSDRTVHADDPRLFCIPSKDKKLRVQVQMTTNEKAEMVVSVWQNGTCPPKSFSGSSSLYFGNCHLAVYSYLSWLIFYTFAIFH